VFPCGKTEAEALNESFQFGRTLFGGRKSHVAVGANQIGGIALDAGMERRIAPNKAMNRKVELGAGHGKRLFDIAIDVSLPIEGAQGGEIFRRGGPR